MIKFILKGLPEGLIGKSSILANSLADVFKLYPELKRFESDVEGEFIVSWATCDG